MRASKLVELKAYIEELRTIKVESQTQVNNRFLSIDKIRCTLNNGKQIEREQILKNNHAGNAVIMLPITKDNNVILVVQPRVFTDRTVGIELPAGYIEPGEDPVISAKRELAEETGLISNDLRLLTKYYQDQGCSRAMNYSYLALDCEKIQEQHLDHDEYIRYFECTYHEALELIDLEYIIDANSLITLEKSKRLIKGGR